MQAIYKGKIHEVWIICQTGELPDWVDYSFKANYIHWTSTIQKQLVADVGGIMITNIGKKYVNNQGKGNGIMFGKIGDVIDLTEGLIVSAKKFEKKYTIVGEN